MTYEHGPSAPVSIITKKLGVTHAALFGRAGSKEQLCPGRPRAVEWLSEPAPDSDVEGRLVEILHDLMEFFQRVVPNLVVLKAAGLAIDTNGGTPPPVALRHPLADWLEGAIQAQTLAPLDTNAVAEGLLGAMEARCFNAYLGGETFAPGTDVDFIRSLVHPPI